MNHFILTLWLVVCGAACGDRDRPCRTEIVLHEVGADSVLGEIVDFRVGVIPADACPRRDCLDQEVLLWEGTVEDDAVAVAESSATVAACEAVHIRMVSRDSSETLTLPAMSGRHRIYIPSPLGDVWMVALTVW
jgi:hypothetical protein